MGRFAASGGATEARAGFLGLAEEFREVAPGEAWAHHPCP